MSLTGNLGFVSLDEVLRLLTRSNQKGAVNVRGEGVKGRIFVTKGGITLATTTDDEGLRHLLVKSELVDDEFLRAVEGGQESFAPVVEKTGGAITDLLREMSVESIYQLGIKGDSFEVYEGQETRYGSPQPFDLEALLEDSKQRLNDWAEVSKTVTDLHAQVSFVRDLGERDEVSIDRDAWKLLSEVGAGASVSQIADELGTTDFWTARVAKRLIDKDLLAIRAGQPVAEAFIEPEPAVTEEWSEPAPEPTLDAAEEYVDPNESWWEEPEEEEAAAEAEQLEPTAYEEPQPAPTDEEAMSEYSDEAEDVEEDTEAFLEKVFSELDSSSDEDTDEEEGYGLLRRRRMGAIRDMSGNDS